MLQLLLSLCVAPMVLSADATLPLGTQLSYRGTLEPATEGGTGKTFDLTLWVVQKSEAGAELLWLIDERSGGEFPWSERFGRTSVDARWRAGGAGPALLLDRGEGRSVVTVPLPFLADEKPLAVGQEFSEGKLNFQVEKASKFGDKSAWRVNARDPCGPKRTLKVDQRSPLAYELVEKFTVGRGEQYQLKLELVSNETLGGDPLAALSKAAEKLLALRGKLALPAQSQDADWKAEQLETLRAELPAVAELAGGTPLSKLLEAASRDVQSQSNRSNSLAELGAKFAGQKVEPFSAKGFGNDVLGLDGLLGQVTVLHFWEYRDEPLKEPYGQVGYLEFMYHRRQSSGLQVYGVAVDGRLSDDATRSAAERSVRKLKSFMNLSYPILLDGGKLIKQFGDPRLLGASLPLFVVIGPDQKILHYHVGHYDVDRDQGLKELDRVVGQALEKK